MNMLEVALYYLNLFLIYKIVDILLIDLLCSYKSTNIHIITIDTNLTKTVDTNLTETVDTNLTKIVYTNLRDQYIENYRNKLIQDILKYIEKNNKIKYKKQDYIDMAHKNLNNMENNYNNMMNDILSDDDTVVSKNIEEKQPMPEMDVNELLTNLKIISHIKTGEKILVEGNKINVDTRYLQWLRRWYNGDNGVMSIIFIEQLLATSRSHCIRLRELLTQDNESIGDYILDEARDQLNDLTIAIGTIKEGLEQLKITYKDHRDVSIPVRLDTCIIEFRRIAESNIK